MSIGSILGRRLDKTIINLGFASNGRMEKEMGELLCELDPCVYAIDCLPNMQPEEVSERCEPLVNQLHKARPDTPILLVEDRSLTNASPHIARRIRLCGVAGNTVWSIVRTSIAIAMVFEGSAEM